MNASTGHGKPSIYELDAYFDAAPRADAEAVDVGAFTLLVSRTPWSYYARPTVGRRQPIRAHHLNLLAQVCAARGVDLAIEWVHEVHPELVDLVLAHGLVCSTHALMVAHPELVSATEVEGVSLRVVHPDDPALLSARAVAEVSFTAGGTAVEAGGAAERDAKTAQLPGELVEHVRDRHRRGVTVTVVAESETGVLAGGSYQPVGDMAEVLAVATLPVARRRGLAGAVTGLLARHAFDHGIRHLLLSAQDDDVARVYRRIGFRRRGTTHAAEP